VNTSTAVLEDCGTATGAATFLNLPRGTLQTCTSAKMLALIAALDRSCPSISFAAGVVQFIPPLHCMYRPVPLPVAPGIAPL